MTTLKLQPGIIYGPVSSRRFGPSLGINLLPPDVKVCSFNCVYCHYGWTFMHTNDTSFIADSFPSIRSVERALEEALGGALGDDEPPAVITFSGNGEPTLHPEFPSVVDVVLAVRDRLAPAVPVQALSNSTTLSRDDVVEALRRLDRRVMKLDAGNEELLAAVNRPLAGIDLGGIVEGLRRLGEVVVQSAFMAGTVDNSGEAAAGAWLRRLRKISPTEVQIYTMDRPTADSALERIETSRLEEIAALVREAGIPATVF